MPERPTDAEVRERMRGGQEGPTSEPRLALPTGSKKLEAKGSPTSLKAAIDRVCDELFNGCVRATSPAGRADGEGTLVFRDGRPCLAAYESQVRSIYGPRAVADIARLAASPMSTVTAVEFHPGATVLLEDMTERVPSAVVNARDLEALGLWPPSAARGAEKRGGGAGTYLCPICSTKVSSTAEECPNCHAPFVEEGEAAPPPRPTAPSPGGRRAQATAAPASKESLRTEIARMKGFVEALPNGLPPSLRLYDDWTIAEHVVKGEKRTAPDGTPLVLIMGEWYVNAPSDRRRFLNPWKG
jgi:hypothetical protein